MKAPPRPGAGLKADLNELALSTAQGATALGIGRARLRRVLAGGSAVSAELALRLEVVIGGTAEGWLRQQAAYDAAQVRARAAEITEGLSRIEARPQLHARPPAG